MICSATINGVHIEVKGTVVECYEFFNLATPKWTFAVGNKKICDPYARHYGNCGAPECPIIDVFSQCSSSWHRDSSTGKEYGHCIYKHGHYGCHQTEMGTRWT